MSANLRPAAVAGMFYPGSATALSRDISQMLSLVAEKRMSRPKAIIAPHAGYIYSGPVAASVYAPLAALRGSIRRIVLLGPTHRFAVNGLALPTSTAFATPLGAVPVDQQAAATIEDMPQVLVSDAAHAQEHSLEVQIPFLQVVFGTFSLLPLAVGHASAEAVCEVLERLWGGHETLFVISSDLSHYLPYNAARQVDASTARRILDLDYAIDHEMACGATPINGLLLAARKQSLQGQLLDLRNSGDTAGDKSRVVGYGAFAFHKTEYDAH